jgi:glycerol-3-phosphate dehydrogenase (NAD(P)+)
MSQTPVQVAVIGGGSWGTALAALLAKKGHATRLWAREEEVVQQIKERGENEVFLPGIALPGELDATTSLAIALSDAEVVLSAVPSQFVGEVAGKGASYIPPDALVVSASKGIELTTLRTMDEVIGAHLNEEQRERFTVLSGPSFSAEVGKGEPTAVVMASRSPEAALKAQEVFQTDSFRVYTNSDLVGVELAGALKNVIALAAGVVTGLGYGHNTLSALMTRGLAEITRLGIAMGASPSTFAGLAGMGDLVLTCTANLSRNRTVGFRLGLGETLDEILGGLRSVAEGVKTSKAVRKLADTHDVEMPICEEVHALLWEGRSPKEAVRNLMLRDPKPEEWS